MDNKLKPHWKMVKFGDVVRNANLVERDPEEAGIDKIVGLDDLDSGNLHIRRWNDAREGTSFTRKFMPGQALFGKRRAYQHKVAYAEFEGICSGDILTFESKDKDALLPELLPFICQTEAFFEYALGTSAGSLSPRTSWGALSDFQFALPPIEEQKSIAEILWTADELVEEYRAIDRQMRLLEKVTLLRSLDGSHEWPLKKVCEIGNVQLGRQRAPKYTTGKYSKPYLRVVNVLDGKLDLSDVEVMDFDQKDSERYGLRAGDILITEGDITSPYNVGRSAIFRDEIEDCCFQNTLIRLRCSERVTPEYVNLYLRYMFYKGVFAGVANTTTVTHLGGTRFASLKLAVPSLERQKNIADLMSQVQMRVSLVHRHVEYSEMLLHALRENLSTVCEAAHV